MLDFDRKPSAKSEEETTFDALNEKYAEKFGKPYVFDFAAEPMTWTEAIADIKRRIADNEPHAAPEYMKGVKY